jgi:hypothetical protein
MDQVLQYLLDDYRLWKKVWTTHLSRDNFYKNSDIILGEAYRKQDIA